MTSVADPIRTTRARVVAALLGLVAATVSALGSWIPSFWGDEAASVLSANRSIPSLFSMLGHVDAVHGTYYLGLHFWVDVFGSSPFSVRFPSALAVGVCVAGVVLLGSNLDSLKLGIVAGVACTVLPRVMGMGDEARSYAFTAAIATWLTLLFVVMLRRNRPSRRQWILYGALLTAGIYVFLYLALIAFAHAAVLLVSARTRPLLRHWILTMVAVLAAVAPLIIAGISEHAQIAFLAHRNTTDFHSLAVTLWFGATPFAITAWAAILAAMGFFVHDAVSRHRAGTSSADYALSPTVIGVAWLFVPSILLVLSHFLIPDFTGRYLSMCAPAAALLMSIGILRLARRRVALIAVACAVIVAVALPGWAQQRGPYGKNDSDWAVISSTIAANTRPGDAIAFDDANRPSRRTRLAMRTYPHSFVGLKDVTLKTPYFATKTWYDSTYSMAAASSLGRLAGVRTIWLIEYSTPAHTDTAGISELLALGFTQKHSIHTHRSVIFEFAR
jgi:mannosyltransferase